MIPRITANGASFRGAGRYYLHDKPFDNEDGERVTPTSSERVAWVETRNLVNEDPEAVIDEMWQTAFDQPFLKEMSGIGKGGGNCEKPVKSLSLAWHPDDRSIVSKADMLEAADGFLENMGWDEQQTMILEHSDTEHPHVHLIINMVHPETGKTMDDFQDKNRALVWRVAYEREHPQFRSVDQAEVKTQERGYGEPSNNIPYTVEMEGRKQEDVYLEQAKLIADLDGIERDLLPERQQEEREAFIKSAGAEFRAVRKAAYKEVAKEFQPDWKAHFSQAKAMRKDAPGKATETAIEKSAKQLNDRQDAARAKRQDEACKALYKERNQRFKDMKLRQKAERDELKEILAADARGEPVDLARANYLMHGDRPLPTVGSQLLQQIQTANENAKPIDDRGAANDNISDDLKVRAGEIQQANEHLDRLLASARITDSGSMANVQMADIDRLLKRGERALSRLERNLRDFKAEDSGKEESSNTGQGRGGGGRDR